MTTHRQYVLPLSSSAVLLSLIFLLGGCAHPEYENRRFVLNFLAVDESGAPLSNIVVSSEQSITQGNSFIDKKSQTPSADGRFHLDTVAALINISIAKDGYLKRDADLRAGMLGSWPRPSDSPTLVRLTLYTRNDAAPESKFIQTTITHTGRIGDAVIDLDRLGSENDSDRALVRVTANTPLPKNALQGFPEKTADGKTALVLRFTSPDAGFLHYTPTPYDDPSDQMLDAPREGYSSTHTLTPARLAQMAEPEHWLGNNEYLYFHVNGRYGRIRIANGEASPHNTVTLEYSITLLAPGTTRFPPGSCGCP